MSARMDFYVKEIRAQILGARGNNYLWVNRCGPMSDRMIYANVRRRTQKGLGFPVNLHRFRHAAATFWSVRDPANVRGVKNLLGHANIRHDGRTLHHRAIPFGRAVIKSSD
jgi:site-specific recombinase XerD